jgi:hypothetical protein
VNGGSPEIVEKDILQWHMRSKISVVLDGTDVIEHKAALKAVVVAHHAGDEDYCRKYQWCCHFSCWLHNTPNPFKFQQV